MKRRPRTKLPSHWLTLRQLSLKYSMDPRTAKRWIEDQGDFYKLRVLKTPAGVRIFDPQLEMPPHKTRSSSELFIFNTAEVADLLGISIRRVNGLAASWKIESRFYGDRRYFSLAEIRRLAHKYGVLQKALAEK